MNTRNIYKIIADELFETFYVDDYKYGNQLDDGTYRLVREKITPVTIENMLKENASLLTYQELHTLNNAHIKWVCIDLDISKQEIDTNTINKDNLKLVKKSADDICKFLKSIKIPYLLEFSGRRGFHIWIIFDELISKEEGFYLVSYILSQVKLQNNIIPDKFPAAAFVGKNSKGVGKGVKLPLSRHKTSQKLSFFLDDNEDFDFNEENWLPSPNNSFLNKQYKILKNKQTVSNQLLKNIQAGYDTNQFLNDDEKYLKSKQIKHNTYLSDGISLEEILTSIKKCKNIASLLKDYQKGLGDKERRILCGLMGNLKSEKDPDLGKNLLLELFSNIKDYNEEITRKNLSNIKYLSPITCNFLGNCEYCLENDIASPVQLIEGVVLEDKPIFEISNIDTKLFATLKKSLLKYASSNDEVPLYPQLKKIENASEKEIQNLINEILNGNRISKSDSYKFERVEGKKIRTLYNLDYKNNFIATYFLFVLNNFFYSEISSFSYGYEFSYSFYNDNIFTNWFVNWGQFSKNTDEVIFNKNYDDYYLVKIDIKGFYDNINQQRLSIKLYEEAPKSIKSKLSELAPEQLGKYKNIINYLISLTKSTIEKNEKGVPQGPAYARYLAELYLLGLDKIIENYIGFFKGREFYYRFVDDAFVFLESEERALELYSEIEKWLNINNLELNSRKSEICNIKKYRESGKFKRYKDDIKYTINKANKNKSILTKNEINKALQLLENLTADVKFGIKDNLRFFYFQFDNDRRLKHFRQKFATIIPFAQKGRGKLFMIFYLDLLKTIPEIFKKLLEQIDRLKGLSFTHYLNTILLEWDEIKKLEIDLNQLIEKATLKDDLSNADKLLLITIAMKENISLKNEFINKCPIEIIQSAIKTPDIKYCNENYGLLKNCLEDITDRGLFLEELYRIINQNELDIDVANKLANYTFTRFSEWGTISNTDLLEKEKYMLLYYHCLCYFTLFYTTQNHTNIKTTWNLLLQKSEKKEIKEKVEFLWIKQLENFRSGDFSRSSYSILLGTTSGSEFATHKCQNSFVKKYRDVLLFLLYSKKGDLSDFLENITNFSDESLFYQWLQNTNVNIYPKDHNICMQNLAVNGLIVLENKTDNKIFIKSINKEIDHTKFDFIKCSNNKNNEFEYSKVGYTSLNSVLDKSNFVAFLKSLAKEIEKHQKFKKDYNVEYPVFYKPIFFNEGIPLVPFYSLYQNRINWKGAKKTNDVDSYWENILEVLLLPENSDIKITSDDNPYNYALGKIEEKFFPSSELIIDSKDDKINFIKKFVELIKDDEVRSIFDFQYYWSQTVLEIIKEKEKNQLRILTKYLVVHFEQLKENKDVSLDILFCVDNNTITNAESLFDFFNSIKNSLICFRSQLTIPKSDISNTFENYIAIINTSFLTVENENTHEEKLFFNEFELKKVSVESNFNFLTTKIDNILSIGDENIELENTYYYAHNVKAFQPLSADNSILVNDKPYSYVRNKEGKYYIYIPENELTKSLDRIKERKESYNELQKNYETTAKFKSLFPIDDFYKKAEELYDSSDTSDLENNLKTHYTDTSNIKERIVNWLSLFNENSIEGSKLKKYMVEKASMDKKGYSIEKLYEAIIECLKAHIPIKKHDIEFFKDKISEYNNSENHLMFPLKHPYQDRNGLERLFINCGIKEREINVDKDFEKLISNDCINQTIVVVADISISGTQARKAIDFYLNEFKSEQELKDKVKELKNKNEKYFSLNSLAELTKLKHNFKNAKEIIFISPVMTEEFKKNVTEKLQEFGLTANFQNSNLLNKPNYLFGEKKLDNKYRGLIETLLKDKDLARKIFTIKDWSGYKRGISESGTKKRNTLLRIGSLPAKHIQLFSLKPKNGAKPLLDYVENWKKEK